MISFSDQTFQFSSAIISVRDFQLFLCDLHTSWVFKTENKEMLNHCYELSGLSSQLERAKTDIHSLDIYWNHHYLNSCRKSCKRQQWKQTNKQTNNILNIIYLGLALKVSTADCRELDFLPPMENKALSGHVIRTVPVTCEGSCMAQCFSEERCVSYNLGPFLNGNHACELSHSDHILHHEDLKEIRGYLFRPTKVSLHLDYKHAV